MTRTFRFLFRFQWPILALPVCMTAAAAGGLAFGSPDGLAPLFFPFLPRLFPFLLLLAGWQLWLYLDLDLSLGGRRQDFFLTSRALFLAEVLVSWGALAAAASFLPAELLPQGLPALTPADGPGMAAYPLLCLSALCLGSALGVLARRYPRATNFLLCFTGVNLILGDFSLLPLVHVLWGSGSGLSREVAGYLSTFFLLGVTELISWLRINTYSVPVR